MADLAESLDVVARESGFSGVVQVVRAGDPPVVAAHGWAHRGERVPNRVGTRFGIASVTKGFTAVVVLGLVEAGLLHERTTARSLLGEDLPLVDDRVTVEQLLAHRSGIGDYLDEEAGQSIDAYVMPVPVHQLDRAEAYLPALGGRPMVAEPGEGFRYNNSGFVLLALLAERASAVPFPELVQRRVFGPAGMTSSGFDRTDSLPGGTAVGYLHPDQHPDALRTNALHLPVVGSGDGGAYSTAADLHAFWDALLAGRLLPPGRLAQLRRPTGVSGEQSGTGDPPPRYGLGVWLRPTGDGLYLEGYDAGVSAITGHEPSTATTWTVLSNTSEGAWPVARAVRAAL